LRRLISLICWRSRYSAVPFSIHWVANSRVTGVAIQQVERSAAEIRLTNAGGACT